MPQNVLRRALVGHSSFPLCKPGFAAWNLSPLAKRFQMPRAFCAFLLAAHLLKGV